ncbi:DUF7285 family protein [Salinarchaeum laminariae]|uniref:DUF7285 family protein n=1 Tax=Salinarchaeum laminariae TaxID=869888 RepID=UPI0020BE590A|nr:hypothetical protein [Salinarchaeum laminariae]
MSRSLPPEVAAWWRDRRGQTEPIAAVVAVLAIGVGITLYAGVAADRSPTAESTDAEATMAQITAEIAADGVLDASASLDPEQFTRPGEAVRLELSYRNTTDSHGSTPPPDAAVTSRPVTVQIAPSVQVAGNLTVWVWES